MSNYQHTVPITAIVENNGQFLFIKRSRNEKNMAGKWVFPGGKIEKGEDAIQGLFRELIEETGLVFCDRVAFLSSYFFLRKEDSSSSLGLVFLVSSLNRNIKMDDSIETYEWINPEDIANFSFSYDDIIDFDKQTRVTIPGMEVHVRNAIVAMKNNIFMDRKLLSVTEYQRRKCSMSTEYLKNLVNANDTEDYLKDNYFPFK